MNETERLQKLIKARLKEIGMSQIELAKKIYLTDHVDYEDEPPIQFVEAFKKKLNRNSTDPTLLQRYVEILMKGRNDLEAKTLLIATNRLEPRLLHAMQLVSEQIDKVLTKQATPPPKNK
jgi:hypothetical protein